MKSKIGYAIALLTLISSSAQALTIGERQLAARATANGALECNAIQPFYWEIGDSSVRQDFASVGGTNFQADIDMNIASASKWIYAAYVAQRYTAGLSAYDIQFLTLESGYDWMDPTSCGGGGATETVNDCLAFYNIIGPYAGHHNGDRNPDHINKFAYNGGHFEAHAAHLPGISLVPGNVINLGAYNDAGLKQEINNVLGLHVVDAYTKPSLPGGVFTTPSNYAGFLRAIMTTDLVMAKYLGTFSVCTNPHTCRTAIKTPVQNEENWHYSIGHWIEDDASFFYDDNAFSNSGSLGFYAWIDSTKTTWYGIIGRDGSQTGNQPDDDTTMGWASVECGRRVRKAWLTGIAQP